MRDRIARTLAWVLSVLAQWARNPRPSKHTAAYLVHQPVPAPTSPWAKPWTSPSKEDARRYFAEQAEWAVPLTPVQRERRIALCEAAAGRDYPYSYPGAPFPRSAFRCMAVAA
ncbi:hypothetical protein [Streptomyces sp. NPDC048442]|uniref:hypothetical protein n=1 Tax=Streptomyces sp. NPDC048442 TaxID=3154823 RepID=UPI0034498ACE